METQVRASFPLPSEIAPVPGTEAAQEMYPYFTRVGPEDDKRFWFFNAMHFPEPMTAFDAITAEAPYIALGAYNSRVFAIPTAKGVDHRIINGRVYISAVPVTDPAEIGSRLELFQDRAFYYYGKWNELYARWNDKIKAMLAQLEGIVVPQLPEFEDRAMVTEGRGVVQNHFLREGYHRCIEGYMLMWQLHFEFNVLGYGAYLTFFEFCQKAFPEISMQTVARMVAGIETLMMRPDDELKKLAALAVRDGIDGAFVDGRPPQDILHNVAGRGEPGAAWLAAFEQARNPWFNVTTGDGFYHHHRSWNDDLTLPFSALTRYVSEVKAGKSLDRPTERLKREREELAGQYRALLATDDERAAFDQMLGLCHLVFPFIEDHKFYCENWSATAFFNKVREFGTLLARHGILAQGEERLPVELHRGRNRTLRSRALVGVDHAAEGRALLAADRRGAQGRAHQTRRLAGAAGTGARSGEHPGPGPDDALGDHLGPTRPVGRAARNRERAAGLRRVARCGRGRRARAAQRR